MKVTVRVVESPTAVGGNAGGVAFNGELTGDQNANTCPSRVPT